MQTSFQKTNSLDSGQILPRFQIYSFFFWARLDLEFIHILFNLESSQKLNVKLDFHFDLITFYN